MRKEQDAIKQQYEEEIQKYEQNKEDAKICEIRRAHLKKLTEMISNRRETEKRIEERRILHSSRKEFKHYEKYLKIWDMRAEYDPPAYKEIGIKIFPDKPKISADLVRKGFCVAYKLIYRKEHLYQNVKKAREEVKKEDLVITCEKCPQRDTC